MDEGIVSVDGVLYLFCCLGNKVAGYGREKEFERVSVECRLCDYILMKDLYTAETAT